MVYVVDGRMGGFGLELELECENEMDVVIADRSGSDVRLVVGDSVWFVASSFDVV